MRRRSEAAAVAPEGETGDAFPAWIQEMLQDLLVGLPGPDRRLIESLFWDLFMGVEVADILGIDRPRRTSSRAIVAK
jgi:hypothetical protein